VGLGEDTRVCTRVIQILPGCQSLGKTLLRKIFLFLVLQAVKRLAKEDQRRERRHSWLGQRSQGRQQGQQGEQK